MGQPLVSVVTITRNRGKLLGRCISSVLAQTYNNIEYIIVDGASNDNTDEVIASFKDERLHFIQLETNWPIKETLDLGISLCQGKYITFLDSDDEYLPNKIEKQVKLIESLSEDYGLVYCWMTYYDDKTKKQLSVHKPELRGIIRDEVIGEPVISGTPTLMFRIELLRTLDGWKSADEIGIISDWELCARACQITKVDFIPESLVNVYENHGSLRQSEKKYYDNICPRSIKFSRYFLTHFAENFKRRPELLFPHYWTLFSCNFRLKHYGCATKWLVKAIINNPKAFLKKLFKYDTRNR